MRASRGWHGCRHALVIEKNCVLRLATDIPALEVSISHDSWRQHDQMIFIVEGGSKIDEDVRSEEQPDANVDDDQGKGRRCKDWTSKVSQLRGRTRSTKVAA